jgi:hypothetical protein
MGYALLMTPCTPVGTGKTFPTARATPEGCAPFWSTGDCPLGLRSGLQRFGPPERGGVEPQAVAEPQPPVHCDVLEAPPPPYAPPDCLP